MREMPVKIEYCKIKKVIGIKCFDGKNDVKEGKNDEKEGNL